MVSLYHVIKEKIYINFFCKNCDLKTSYTPFCVCKELSTTSFEKWYFWRKLPILAVYNSKTAKICPNQHAELIRLLFKEDSIKIKKGLELVSSSHFALNFVIKSLLLWYYINWSNFITKLCLPPNLFSKMCFGLHA